MLNTKNSNANFMEHMVSIAISLHNSVTNENEGLTELLRYMSEQIKSENSFYKFNKYIDICSDLQPWAKYCRQIHEIK